jgi:hypothetical protein
MQRDYTVGAGTDTRTSASASAMRCSWYLLVSIMERDDQFGAINLARLLKIASRAPLMEVACFSISDKPPRHDINASQHQESPVKVSSSISLVFTPQLHI